MDKLVLAITHSDVLLHARLYCNVSLTVIFLLCSLSISDMTCCYSDKCNLAGPKETCMPGISNKE